jgi:hypothetical protein
MVRFGCSKNSEQGFIKVETNLTELVKGKYAHFIYYQDGNLFYCLGDRFEPTGNFNFPVPIADCGSARFMGMDKAIFYMKWIKSHLKTVEEGKNGKQA